ncbi:50S ribosomal protein L30 [Candidatus Woesearchaeota archaeon]|jgi:large subunit ribosomal protein L30|nr:50S ribosomal protein L30 [Candidatus Woesearchaeota archaeon]
MTEEKTSEPKTETKEPATTSDNSKNKFAAVLVRGRINIPQPLKDTLDMLKLRRKNHCAIVENNPVNLGMLKKVKDYITWGEVSEETTKELFEKRGEEYAGPEQDPKGKIDYSRKFTKYNNKKYKKRFCLSPPRKGFGRKGIKFPFTLGGALGYRGDKINDLIKRMIE